MSKSLSEIIECLPKYELLGVKKEISVKISGITADSRAVQAGSLFIALSGYSVDGHDYIEQAVKCGATAVIAERMVLPNVDGVIFVVVPDTRVAMQKVAPFFYDFPSQKMRMVAVTGTNGKTTTTYLLSNIFKKAGYKTGIIGTIKAISGEREIKVKNTTPDVIDLQMILAQMRDDGVQYVFMEVSSHALSLNRIAGCEFDGAIFTNLTRDHLDFHGDMESYFKAKQMLFSSLLNSANQKTDKWCVGNVDDAVGKKMLSTATGNVKTMAFAINQEADIRATNVVAEAQGTKLEVCVDKERFPLHLKLSGLFNVYNALGVIAGALAEGLEISFVLQAIGECGSVDGRFELVQAGQDFTVVVDYAHTPDGLENVLRTARDITKGRLIAVFGCGGDRDRTKRPIMGKLAASMADIIIATSDNPRSENAGFILSEIEVGIQDALKERKNVEYFKIVDRRQGIKKAIILANKGDVVLIAGKGHETYQILNEGRIDFDDRLVVKDCIRECVG